MGREGKGDETMVDETEAQGASESFRTPPVQATPVGGRVGGEGDEKGEGRSSPGVGVRCPACGGPRAWRDGFYRTRSGRIIQRYMCPSCYTKFSPGEKSLNSYTTSAETERRRVCVSDLKGEMENLAGVDEENEKNRREHGDIPTSDTTHTPMPVTYVTTPSPAPATAQVTPEAAALLYQYGQWMKKEGYAISTITTRVKILRILTARGADLHDPESVKAVTAEQQWCNKRKMNAVDAYTTFLRMKGGTWDPPRYMNVETLPFIPTEKEIDDLIAGCGPRTATFLLFLKETAARAGEATRVKWTDVDLEAATVRITPEKGSRPRVFKLSLRLMAMINAMKAGSKSSNVFNKSQGGVKRVFERQRKKLALKLQNPRLLMIHFHTFRHWKATTEYARTRDILHVMQLLGHKRIQNTLIYTQLTNFKDDEYATRVARSAEEAQPLIEGGFEYVCTTPENAMLFRKRK